MVRHEMEATYGAQRINAVNMVRDTRKLEPLLKKYEVTKRKLEDLNDDYIGKLRRKQPIKRKQVRRPRRGRCGLLRGQQAGRPAGVGGGVESCWRWCRQPGAAQGAGGLTKTQAGV